MRNLIRQFAEICEKTLSLREPIYEFGSFLVEGQEEIADLRKLFPSKKYVGCDMREGPGVDMILNLHDIELPEGTAGTVFCFETLEHVEYPRKAIEEIHRILDTDGIAIISSEMKFPIHNFPYDYWRFTPDGFRSLLKPFKHSFVESAGHNRFPHTVVGIGFKGEMPEGVIEKLDVLLTPWKNRWKDPSNNRFEKFAKRLFSLCGLETHRKYPETM